MPQPRSIVETSNSTPAKARHLGVVFAAVGLGLFVVLVGVGSVIDVLETLRPSQTGALLAAGLFPIAIWGCSLWIVLDTIDVTIRLREAVLLFLVSVYLNGITPFGQLGGDPPSGLVIGHVEDTGFETGFAAITSVNALNRVGVVILGTGGAVWLLARGATPGGLRTTVTAALVLVGLLVATAVVAWRRRDTLVHVGGGGVAILVVWTTERLPGLRSPSRDAVLERVREYVVMLERLSTHPARVGAALVLGVVGQLAVAAVLWLALAALGGSIEPAIVVIVIPVAKLGGLAPLPGGSVSAEILLSGLLVTAGGVTPPVATATVLLYRAAAFWLPTILGGVATVWILHTSG